MLPDGASLTEEGHLALGGCDAVELADRFGTPLYVYDVATLRARARAYRSAAARSYPAPALICYAAKAYAAPWLLRLVADEGLGLDVVSGGELAAAARAGFPADRIYFHGNNKARDELELALDMSVGRTVVDNLDEVRLLESVLAERPAPPRADVLLRLTPGVEAHTHEHIKTGVLDSKFGLSIQTGAAREAAERVLASDRLRLLGFHSHIGSQIFEIEPYREALRRVVAFAGEIHADHPDFVPTELSPGGGFGIRYQESDDPPPLDEVIASIADAAQAAWSAAGFSGAPLPRMTLEPGRSIVGPAAVALYRVGGVKVIPGIRTYVSVDGGMADNIRPTAYGALYAPLLANRAAEDPEGTFAIAGRYCESGDVLVREARLPNPHVGDIVAVPASGAYQLSMASNYNLVPRPAAIAVEDGAARLVTRRETYDDLLRTSVDAS